MSEPSPPAAGRQAPGAPSVSAAVMAHPSRAAMVDDLVARLDGPATVVWDERSNEWDTARRSLLAYDPAADYHVVIQDDGLPCRDLLAGVAAAIPYAPPGAVLGLYAGAVSPRVGSLRRAYADVDALGAVRLVSARLWWGVAVAYPTGLLPDLVARADGIAVLEYDRRVSSILRRRGVPIAYTIPSLVEHREGPSLLAHDRADHRRAHRFLGADVSALDVAWDGPTVEIPDPRAAYQARRISRRPTVTRRG